MKRTLTVAMKAIADMEEAIKKIEILKEKGIPLFAFTLLSVVLLLCAAFCTD